MIIVEIWLFFAIEKKKDEKICFIWFSEYT